MNALEQLVLRTACNMIQWYLDRHPAPQNEQIESALKEGLASHTQPLRDAVAHQ